MSDAAMIRAAGGAITGFSHDILLSTTDAVAGRRIAKVIGMVRGNAVRARHVGHDIMAALRNLAGGEIREYTKLLGESREQAIDRMVEQAVGQGANAVVGVRFTTSMVLGGAAELLAYGTAVVLQDEA